MISTLMIYDIEGGANETIKLNCQYELDKDHNVMKFFQLNNRYEDLRFHKFKRD